MVDNTYLNVCSCWIWPKKSVKFDGEPLPDVLLGRSDASREAPLYFRRPPDRPEYEGEDTPDLAVRDGQWKLLCEYDGSQPELYDLAADRGETKNVAAAHPDVVKRLTKNLLAWNESMPQDKGESFKPARKKKGKR